MAKHDINFRQGGPITGDSGERGNNAPGIASIKPYTDGERAVAANFDRPPENIRQRTEALRGELEAQKYLQDGDMKWILGSGNADGFHVPPASWPMIEEWREWPGDPTHRWYFKLTPGVALVVQPSNTPPQGIHEIKFWEFPDAANGVQIEMERWAYSEANIREVIWEALPPAEIVGTHGIFQWVDLTLSGEDGHILTITIRDDATKTQLGHLAAAFAAWDLGYLRPAGFICTAPGLATNPVDITTIPPADVDYIFAGTFERELHYITAETLWDFFNAGGPAFPNLMSDGDTLAVMWEYFIDPAANTGRRQAIMENGNTEVLVPQLFLTSLHPEWIPLAIPLCKRINKELVWLDGTIATEGMTQPIRFGENGYTVERIFAVPTSVPISMTSMWYGAAVPPAWSTLQDALDGIVSDLASAAGTSGADCIGVAATAVMPTSRNYYNVPGPGDSIQNTVIGILDVLNTKGTLGEGPTFGNEEVVTGRWLFNNHLRLGMDRSVLRYANTAEVWTLVYRDDGRTETNADIGRTTYSIYIYRSLVDNSVTYMHVYGGYVDPVTGKITAAASEGGVTVHFTKHGNATLTGGAHEAYGCRYSVAGSTVLDPEDPNDWDLHSYLKHDGSNYLDNTVTGWEGTPGRPGGRWVWDAPQLLNRIITQGSLLHSYIQGALVGPALPDDFAVLFKADGTCKPSMRYNDYTLMFASNATYNNITNRWSGITNILPAAGFSVGNGANYQYAQISTVAAWSFTGWDVWQKFSDQGNNSLVYQCASLSPTADATTHIRNAGGLVVVTATFPSSGGRRTALYRVDALSTDLVSGNNQAPPVWDDDLLGTGTNFLLTLAAGGYLKIVNNFAIDDVTDIEIGTYLGGWL